MENMKTEDFGKPDYKWECEKQALIIARLTEDKRKLIIALNNVTDVMYGEESDKL